MQDGVLMNENDIGIPIPAELISKSNNHGEEFTLTKDFGIKNIPLVRVTRNNEGLYSCVEYYNTDKTLSKKVFYTSENISHLEKYKNGILIYTKDYNQENNKLGLITYYSPAKDVISKIKFEYSRDNRIKEILKIYSNESYGIEYNYDELYRVNSRKIFINNKVVEEEKFKLDIFERIVEYQNRNISIYVLERTKSSKLSKYKIVDNHDNELYVSNKFGENDEYINTEVILNGKKTVTKNVQYLDNKYLKKPTTSPEDLELVIMRFSNDIAFIKSKNVQETCINKQNILPITMRKLNLYNQAIKA